MGERDGLDISGRDDKPDKLSINPNWILGAGVGYLVYNHIKQNQNQQQQQNYNRPPQGYHPGGYYPGFQPGPYNPYQPQANYGFGQPTSYPSQTISGSYPITSGSSISTSGSTISTSYPTSTTTYYPTNFGRTNEDQTAGILTKPVQFAPIIYTF